MERNHRRVQDRIRSLKRQWAARNLPCWACGITLRYDVSGLANSVEADHVIPVARGGSVLGDMRPACRTCNRKRQDKDADEFFNIINGIATHKAKGIPEVKRPMKW